jgi:hypothetical protein
MIRTLLVTLSILWSTMVFAETNFDFSHSNSGDYGGAHYESPYSDYHHSKGGDDCEPLPEIDSGTVPKAVLLLASLYLIVRLRR